MEGYELVITVDTHVIIWDALKPSKLSKKAKKAISEANENDGMIFCEISLWEIAMLIKKKRFEIDVTYSEFIRLLKHSGNYIFKGITPDIAELSTNLPAALNNDPADRVICATAIMNNTVLITADKNIRKSKLIETVW